MTSIAIGMHEVKMGAIGAIRDVEVVKRLACPTCSAPGQFLKRLSDADLAALAKPQLAEYEWRVAIWPDVFVSDERADKPIDDVCPCCAALRPQPIKILAWKKDVAQ